MAMLAPRFRRGMSRARRHKRVAGRPGPGRGVAWMITKVANQHSRNSVINFHSWSISPGLCRVSLLQPPDL
jgi:hypothetical protein